MTYKEIVDKYGRSVDVEAAASGLSAALVYAVIFQESSGNAAAKSSCGCMGLMQIQPTAALVDYNVKHRLHILPAELYVPSVNIMVGCWYLAWLIQRLGGIFDALRAYNIGIGNVKKGRTLNGSDGSDYARSVLHHQSEIEKILS